MSTDRNRSFKVVVLVSAGHCLSHLYTMVVPPLVVVWVSEFQIDYTEVGIVMAVAAIVSAISVVPVGTLADRLPARFILVTGLSVISLATIGFGLASTYTELLICAAFSGLGNTVFHPCGYSILSANVARNWLGRAFSVHTFAGYVGFALTPAIIGVSILYWDWRSALIVMGAIGLVVAAVMLLSSRMLTDEQENSTQTGSAERTGNLSILLTLPVLMCFLFYLFTTIAYWGFDTYLPASLYEHHNIPESTGVFALTVFFGFSSVGILIGGVIADRTSRHGMIAATGFTIAATCIFLTGEIGSDTAIIFVLVAIAGLGAGVVTPSRDLIVRQVTPPQQTGRVFAFMTLAMDAGSFVAPPFFGFLMDQGEAIWLFRGAALMLILSILTVTATRRIHQRMALLGHASSAR